MQDIFSSLFFFILQAVFEYPNIGLLLQEDANCNVSALFYHVPRLSLGLETRGLTVVAIV